MKRLTLKYFGVVLAGLASFGASAYAQGDPASRLEAFLPPVIPAAQGGHPKGVPTEHSSVRDCDMGALREFLAASLTEHPSADPDSLSRAFLEQWFGPAEPSLDYYLRLRRKSFEYSHIDPKEAGSPLAHSGGMLSPRMMARYNELFDAAEDAVWRDPVLLGRVREARLPLQYCELEFAREKGEVGRRNDVALALFEQRCGELGVSDIFEGLSVAGYLALYRRRAGVPAPANLSVGRGVDSFAAPGMTKEAAPGMTGSPAAGVLTDGAFGTEEPDERWVGWESSDGLLTVDLGEVNDIRAATADFLEHPGKRVLAPLRVGFFTSEDGKIFTHWTTLDVPATGPAGSPAQAAENPAKTAAHEASFIPMEARTKKSIRARYVRIHITSPMTTPDGSPAWILIDEITVL